jgi:integrase
MFAPDKLWDVVVVGDFFMDTVMTGFFELPRMGEEAFAQTLRQEVGGGDALTARRMTQRSMYRVLMNYLERLPGAMQEIELLSGEKAHVCVYSPHSIRATTATLLLDSSVPIESVQDLLDHKHITTTQIYDKRRRSVRDSASHKVPI